MLKENTLYLKTTDLLTLKPIGQGTDGKVYKYKKDILIKLFHQAVFNITSHHHNLEEDMKIYQKNDKTNWKNSFYTGVLKYYVSDTPETSLLLHSEIALKKIIERQKDIKYTHLPIGSVYLNGYFAGCMLKKIHGIQIHKLIGLPLKYRKKIYLNILKCEAELLKNNIYHCDLSNSPYTDVLISLPDGHTITKGHSHIIVNPFNLQTHFIDLDGKSTIYTEQNNEKLKQKSLEELAKLTTEFLLKVNLDDYKEYPEEMIPELEEHQIYDCNLQQKIYEANMTLEELEQLCLTLKK